MCGIVGIINANKNSETNNNLVVDGLERLQNRGYDSAGIVSHQGDSFYIKKNISDDTTAINKLIAESGNFPKSNISIGHTRWATHGGININNSHPHISFDKKISLVHNGILENFLEIKNMLTSKGIEFYSETDSEVIVNLIAYHYSKTTDINLAIKNSTEIMKGTWALLILLLDDPNSLFLTRNNIPLLVSISKNNDYGYIASEQTGLSDELNQYFIPNSDKICCLSLCNQTIKVNYNGLIDYHLIDRDQRDHDKLDSPHWTIHEIKEQPQRIKNCIMGRIKDQTIILPEIDKIWDKLKNIDNLVILGCGTSYFAGMLGKNYFRELNNFNIVLVIDASEFTTKDIPKNGNTGFILLGQSGETKDLYRCILKIGDRLKIGVINVTNSLITREIDTTIYIRCGKEVGVASTKSFTNQCLCLGLLAIYISQKTKINQNKAFEFVNDIKNLSSDILETINLVERKIDHIINIVNRDNLFLIGKGKSEAIAREGALKIKEISYIHAEGYSSSSLKHGPFALLNPQMPSIIIAPHDEHWEKVNNTYYEIMSRNSPILFITNKKCKLNNSLVINYNKSFGDLISIVPIQLLAYFLSVKRGINPDLPRNLAKSVVVD